MDIKSKKIKLLFSNFLSLSVLQALNLVLPLITIPYLIHTIGVEKFGLLAFINAIILYFQIFVEFGFNATATRDISLYSSNPVKLAQEYSEILSAKLTLLAIAFVTLLFACVCIPALYKYLDLYIYSFGTVIGLAISPVWFFQGMQQMRYVTVVNVIFKTASTIAIFLLVNNERKFWLVPLLTSSGFIVSGFFSLLIIRYQFNIIFKFQQIQKIKKQLQIAKHIFFSELQMTLLSSTNLLIIGILLGNISVGYYSSVEKLVRAISNINSPIINSIYPYISREMIEDRKKAINSTIRIAEIGSLIQLLLIFASFFFAEEILRIVYNSTYNIQTVIIFKILIFLPLLSYLDQVFGKFILLNSGRDKQFMMVFFVSGCFSLISTFLLTSVFGYIGTAVACILSQFLVVFGMIYYSFKVINSEKK